MLKKTERKSITGYSMIGEKPVFQFTASIDSDNPENMNINYLQIDKTLHEANLATCRADQAEFEDYVYAVKNEMAEMKKGE